MSFVNEPERDDLFDAQTLIDFTELRKAPERLKAAIDALRDQAARLNLIADSFALDCFLEKKEERINHKDN